jgi:hypothetical protein
MPDITLTSISNAIIEKARRENDLKLYEEILRKHSLRLTRAGQEIAMERGRLNQHSAEHFIRQVIAGRMENLKKNYTWEFIKGKMKGKSNSKITDEIIKNEVQKVKKKLRI